MSIVLDNPPMPATHSRRADIVHVVKSSECCTQSYEFEFTLIDPEKEDAHDRKIIAARKDQSERSMEDVFADLD